mmetsp:Transcript_22039/g.52065  ORF Transcript_22039/g.52065 Transcript_22039/m.52065 type:complete len:666 (+) Transcript_22039:188-2185(+)
MVRFPRLGGRSAAYKEAVDSQAASEDAGDETFKTEDPTVSSLLESSVRRRSSVPAADIERAASSKRQYSLSTSLGEDIFEENAPSKFGSGGEAEEEINPFSKDYVGLTASYLGVGAMLGSSSSLLYPLLIVKNGVSSSFMAASHSVVMLWWSYKILFGFLSDCFPIFGFKRRPYIIFGWVMCLFTLLCLARGGNDISASNVVVLLSVCNLCYVFADTSADGAMVSFAHKEPIERRGRIQTHCYSMASLGKIIMHGCLLLGFSGPEMNCAGYQPDAAFLCTTDEAVLARVEPGLIQSYPTDWCHQKCSRATFDFDLPIHTLAMGMCMVIFLSLPLYANLKEEKVQAEPRLEYLRAFWSQLERKACWQIILYGMVSHITMNIQNVAKPEANYAWLELTTFQQQLMSMLESLSFFVALKLIRRYALNFSWRKMVLIGSGISVLFNCSYYLVVFDILRSSWFYVITDVSESFMYTLNIFVSLACMVEISEEGYESITYALITTSSNVVRPLSNVISFQLLTFFPSLVTQESIATDTFLVRQEFASLQMMVILLNLSSLLSTPLLPRQKKETLDLVALGERSTAWGKFVILSVLVFMMYSTTVTFITVHDHETYGCYKIFGGRGCTEDESSIPALMLVLAGLLYCYGTNFVLTYLPILRGESKLSLAMFT